MSFKLEAQIESWNSLPLCPIFYVHGWGVGNKYHALLDVINIIQKYFWVIPLGITLKNDQTNKIAQIIFLTVFV